MGISNYKGKVVASDSCACLLRKEQLEIWNGCREKGKVWGKNGERKRGKIT